MRASHSQNDTVPSACTTVLMAVPQYPPPIVGGLEKQAHDLAAELVRRGHRVLALSGRITPDQPAVARVDGVEVYRLGWPRSRFVRWFASPFMVWRQMHRLVRHVDVIHVHVISGFGLFVILLANAYGKPVLVKLANVGAGGLPGLARGPIGPLRTWLFMRADAVVAMSRESLTELQGIGFDQARVLITPNGVRAMPDGQTRSGTESSVCRFAFVGRLHEHKGLSDLLVAVRKLVDDPSCGPFIVDILGDGPQRETVLKQIDRMNLRGRVRLLGHVAAVGHIISGYDVFVLPSHREGNSNAILEAMAAGLPIISTRVGGTEMLVGVEGQPLLHEPGDVEELARLMHKQIADPCLRATRGCAMRRRVALSFDIRQVASTYAHAYCMLAKGRATEMAALGNSVVTE